MRSFAHFFFVIICIIKLIILLLYQLTKCIIFNLYRVMTQTRKMSFLQHYLLEVPVMRNGKATKRMKKEWAVRLIEVDVHSVLIEGRQCWVRRDGIWSDYSMVYRHDGTAVTCDCQFGAYGTKAHREALYYYHDRRAWGVSTTGYNGATGRGWGASIRTINW